MVVSPPVQDTNEEDDNLNRSRVLLLSSEKFRVYLFIFQKDKNYVSLSLIALATNNFMGRSLASVEVVFSYVDVAHRLTTGTGHILS